MTAWTNITEQPNHHNKCTQNTAVFKLDLSLCCSFGLPCFLLDTEVHATLCLHAGSFTRLYYLRLPITPLSAQALGGVYMYLNRSIITSL